MDDRDDHFAVAKLESLFNVSCNSVAVCLFSECDAVYDKIYGVLVRLDEDDVIVKVVDLIVNSDFSIPSFFERGKKISVLSPSAADELPEDKNAQGFVAGLFFCLNKIEDGIGNLFF